MKTRARDIGLIILKSERAVKFQAARMMLEVLAGRKLSVVEQKKIYNRVQYWKPWKIGWGSNQSVAEKE